MKQREFRDYLTCGIAELTLFEDLRKEESSPYQIAAFSYRKTRRSVCQATTTALLRPLAAFRHELLDCKKVLKSCDDCNK
jgi:hypothetical protein